ILKNIALLQDEWSQDLKFIVYLKEKPREDLPKETECWKYKVLPTTCGLWVLTKLMPELYLSRQKPDLLFTPSHYTVPFSPVPRVCSIMDLGYLDFSGHFKKITYWQLKYWTAISIFVSKCIIAISNATKKDIVRHYPFASNKVVVTHLGYDRERFNRNISDSDVRRVMKRYSIVDDYILYIGTLKPSKNIDGVIRAFKEIGDTKNIKLVIAGKKGWMYGSIYELVKKLGLEGRIIFTGYLLEEDKPAILKGARVLVSPSFWEGFGLHVLEAMACGTPVVVSRAGSFPEVVGKAGVLVDPHDVPSIAEGIRKVINMPEIGYNELVRAGFIQADKFKWEGAARKTIGILKKAI
ncbi:MAG: glycosyltransferase family 1 protein, partial [bacterium]